MIVEIPVFFAKGKTPMRVELQIRTNGMDLEGKAKTKNGVKRLCFP